MEVSIRFTTFLLVLIIMLYVRYSSAQTFPGASNRKLGPVGSRVVGPEGSPMNFEKEIDDGVSTAPEGGKKMIQRRLGMVLVKEESIDHGVNHNPAKKKNISGEGILNHHKECNRGIMNHRRLKAKMADFMAFNADYHVPRPHPPKNN